MTEDEKLVLAIEESQNIAAPDLTIRVQRIDLSERTFKYRFTLISFKKHVNLYFRECESRELGRDYNNLLESKFQSFNSSMRSKDKRNKLNKRLRNFGKQLYRTLFDYEFDALYWDHIRNKVRSIQIISDESIPWELIFPVNLREEASEKKFWGELYDTAHWFPGNQPVDEIRINSLDLVRALEDQSASLEEEQIRQICDRQGITVNSLDASTDSVVEAFSSSQFSLLHLICHGGISPEDADQDFIRLSDGHIMPDDVEDCDVSGVSDSVVFLNGCQTGIIGSGLLGLGGWAYNLATRAKRNVVLGPIWNVPNDSASAFATAFYDALYAEQPSENLAAQDHDVSSILKAVRHARKQSKANDPTRLSYKVYGSPLAYIRRSEAKRQDQSAFSDLVHSRQRCDSGAYATVELPEIHAGEPYYLEQIYELRTYIEGQALNSNEAQFRGEEIICFSIVIWAEDMEIEPSWNLPFLYDKTALRHPAEFRLKPLEIGTKKIRIDFLRERQWVAKIEFEVEVVEG